MRIGVIGGGPGGLYLAALVKQVDPATEVVVWERRPDEHTFGFGVVFSDGALGGIQAADPVLFDRIGDRFARWDTITVVHDGTRIATSAPGFAAVGRQDLLSLLRERCRETAVDLRTATEAPDPASISADFDVVVAADGVGSATRTSAAPRFGTRTVTPPARHIWLGTDHEFDSLTFAVADTPAGTMTAHAYPYSPGHSTFIVEMSEPTWRAAGFATADTDARTTLATTFTDVLDGHALTSNESRWNRFTIVDNTHWSDHNIVLLGDAAHTTHFSIGSGTKLAMEDALALTMALSTHDNVPDALSAYAADRIPAVTATQRIAEISRTWFHTIDDWTHLPADQFAAHLLTRSGRLTHRDLPVHDHEHVDRVRALFAAEHTATGRCR